MDQNKLTTKEDQYVTFSIKNLDSRDLDNKREEIDDFA